MTDIKKIPRLPVELWIDILEHNAPNPLELMALAGIEQDLHLRSSFISNTLNWIKKYFFLDSISPRSFKSLRGTLLDGLADAATHNSLMKAYHEQGIEEKNFLNSFYLRLKSKGPNKENIIISHYQHRSSYHRGLSTIDDFDLAMSFCMTSQKSEWLSKATDKIKKNKQIMLAATTNNKNAWNYVVPSMKDDEDFMSTSIQKDISLLPQASKRLRDNKDFMSSFIKKNINLLNSASKRLKDDKEFMGLFAEKDVNSLIFASERLKDDKEFMYHFAEKNINSLWIASDRLKDDKGFMSLLIEKNRYSLWYASERLRDDNNFMLLALEKDIDSLQYASKRLTGDKYFMMKAIQTTKSLKPLRYANNDLRDDIGFMLEVMKKSKDTEIIWYASRKIRNDETFISAIKQLKYGN